MSNRLPLGTTVGKRRMKQTFDLTVNGQRRQLTTEPDTTLLHVLRNDLGLKGTRF
ncbi:MAG: hypothetical protein IRY92_10490, partial [Dactylosporangium sp.]|nr:hypothetical protein [Dactylosporangium sp.]